ncbi:hypothetical protein PM082_005566 [Marasmius tenuissimus]|nr:hypothetical protein PM082_005566 [Marasmius tenuissimus]
MTPSPSQWVIRGSHLAETERPVVVEWLYAGGWYSVDRPHGVTIRRLSGQSQALHRKGKREAGAEYIQGTSRACKDIDVSLPSIRRHLEPYLLCLSPLAYLRRSCENESSHGQTQAMQ